MTIVLNPCFSQKTIWSDTLDKSVIGFYLIAQIESIKKDSTSFYVIEIYAYQPLLEFKLVEEDSVKKTITTLSLLDRSKYSTGIIKKAKKNLIGKTILLYTGMDLRKTQNFVTYVQVPSKDKSPLWELYRIGTTKNENERYPRYPTTLQYKTVEK